MVIIEAQIDDEGRISFPTNMKTPSGYIGCHTDNMNFYFFFSQEEMNTFFEKMNSNPS